MGGGGPAALPAPEALEEAAVTARAGVHSDEASTDGDDSEEELEMAESEDNVELDGNLGLHDAMTGNVITLIDE